jgi:hypothetical protein
LVSEIRIYFEGQPDLREGFHLFFGDLIKMASERRVRFNLIACGDGAAVTKRLQDACKERRRNELVLALKDSEGPLDRRSKVDPREHWMVELMESWFLADPAALEDYFSRLFKLGKIAPVETIPKKDVYAKLKAATKACNKRYTDTTKSEHARNLLGRIDARVVRRAAPHCDRLFKTIEAAL